MRNHQNSKHIAGFSLLESMLVLILVGLLLSGLLTGYTVYNAERKEVKADSVYDTVRSSINSFITENMGASLRARYPCPARLDIGPSDAQYGQERRNPDGTCQATADGSNGVFDAGDVYIGALPAHTLRLTTDKMLDVHGNKLTYAITKAHVLDNALLSNPANKVEVRDETGTSIMAPFALISHGQDGAGAYSIEGGVVLPCQDSSTADGENCDFDDAVFKESRVKLGNSSDFYDDRLAFTLADDDDDEWWGTFDDNPDHIYNRNPGIVCFGPGCHHSFAEAGDVLVVNGNARIMNDLIAEGMVIAQGNIQTDQNIHAVGNIVTDANIEAAGYVQVEGGVAVGDVDPAAVPEGHIVAELDITALRDLIAGRNVNAANDITAGQNLIAGGNLDVEGTTRIGNNPPGAGALGVDGEVRIQNGGLMIDSDGDGSWGGIYNSPTGEGLVLSAKLQSVGREDIVIHEGGNVGIGGITTPKTALDVNGAVKMGMDDTNCSRDIEGAQRYNATEKNMEFCDGDEWRPVSSGLDIITVEERLCTRGGTHTLTASCPSGFALLNCVTPGGDFYEDYEYVSTVPDYVGNKCQAHISNPAYFGDLNSCARLFAACYRHRSGAGYTPTTPGEPPTININGECGSDNGTVRSSTPTNLCAMGTASAVSGSGPWTWQCRGHNGGATASCRADRYYGGASCSGTASVGNCRFSGNLPHARVIHTSCSYGHSGNCAIQCYDGNWVLVSQNCYDDRR